MREDNWKVGEEKSRIQPMTVTDAPKEEISLGLDTSEVTDFQSANTLYNIMSSKKVILEAKPHRSCRTGPQQVCLLCRLLVRCTYG